MATVRSKQAVRHVAWSPYNPCQAACICHDGSLHIFTLSQPPLAPAGSSVEVNFPGCSGCMLVAFFTLHALLQCNAMVPDQADMDSDIVSSGRYVNMYVAYTALKRFVVWCTWHACCMHAVVCGLTQLSSCSMIKQAC